MKLRKKTAIRILTAFMALAMVSTNVINTSFITVSAVETVTKTASSSSIEGYCGENVQYKLEQFTGMHVEHVDVLVEGIRVID